MSRPSLRLKLKVKLTAALALSLILAILLFLGLQIVGSQLLDRHFYRAEFIAEQNKKIADQFAKYVSDNQLSIKDQDRISDWVTQKKYVLMYIYQNDVMVYSSDGYYSPSEQDIAPFAPEDSLYNISFTDADTKIFVELFDEYKYYNIMTFSCLALSFIFFLVLVLFIINVKTSYIEVLENEIKILEGGNLEYPITIKGKDELASLAQSLNEMRKSFIERLENEEQARTANNELVTAMSHDLRTPLTALIGYLDIIQYRKYKSEEQLFKYVANSKDNAYRIKHLSDQLFEYFLLSYNQNEPPELQEYDGAALLDQFIGTHSPLLIEEGFQFEFIPCNEPFKLSVDVISMQRVFDNLFSNLLKYADPTEPITIRCLLQNGCLYIQFKNHIKSENDHTDSNSIGIKVCEKIVQNHHGSLAIIATKDLYHVEIALPAYTPNE